MEHKPDCDDPRCRAARRMIGKLMQELTEARKSITAYLRGDQGRELLQEQASRHD